MSAPSFVGVSAAGSETSVPWPSGHASGDLGIVDVEHGVGTVTTPTDFTILTAGTFVVLTGSNDTNRSSFYRRATSAAEANADLAGYTNHAWGVISAFRNAHQIYPLHAHAACVRPSNVSGETPGFKTLVDDCIVHISVAITADATTFGASALTNADLTNVTLRYQAGTITGHGGGVFTYTGEKAAAGDVRIGAYTVSTPNNQGITCLAIAPIADIPIAGTVSHGGTGVTGGSVRLLDLTQPAATYLVLNGSEQDAAASVTSGAFSMLVPYTDHEYVAIYTDSSGRVYGASQVLTYSGSAFPQAVIQTDGTVAFPVITGATTPENIRDRIIALITAITPTSLSGDKFRVSRDESEADFRAACASAPTGCLRRFQVRSTSKRGTPAVSNVDVARHTAEFRITLAYPNTHRYGGNAGRSRDDVIDEDLQALDWACGVFSRGNFTVATSSNCTPLGFDEDPPVETEGAVSYLVITARYEYAYQVTPS